MVEVSEGSVLIDGIDIAAVSSYLNFIKSEEKRVSDLNICRRSHNWKAVVQFCMENPSKYHGFPHTLNTNAVHYYLLCFNTYQYACLFE